MARSPVAPVVSDDGVITWLLERGGGTIRSDDDGVTWTTADGGGAISPIANVLVELPGGVLVTIGNSHPRVVERWRPHVGDTSGPPLPYEPNGVSYAPFRDTYYVWRFDCDFTTDNPIAPDAIMRWDAGGSP